MDTSSIAALAAATRLLSERAHMIGIIECCLMSIKAKDAPLAAAARHLSAIDRALVEAKLDAQDTRLADAILGLTAEPSAPATDTAPVPSAICHAPAAARTSTEESVTHTHQVTTIQS